MKEVVYGVKVTPIDPSSGREVSFKEDPYKIYTGNTIDLKKRRYQHNTSFNPSKSPSKNNRGQVIKTIDQLNENKRKKLTLAGHIWDLRDAGLTWALSHH